MRGTPLTQEQRDRIRELYPHLSTKQLAEMIGRSVSCTYRAAAKMGLKKTTEYLASPAACRWRREQTQAQIENRFKPGQVPPNKGLRRPGWAPGRMSETQFKKGQPPVNWKPVGSLRLVDGYLYRKVSDKRFVAWTQNWELEHRRIWEKANKRKINWRTHALVFRDGDRKNVQLENLELITRKELRRRNSIHVLPEPLKEVLRLKGTINQLITKRRKKLHGQEQAQRSA